MSHSNSNEPLTSALMPTIYLVTPGHRRLELSRRSRGSCQVLRSVMVVGASICMLAAAAFLFANDDARRGHSVQNIDLLAAHAWHNGVLMLDDGNTTATLDGNTTAKEVGAGGNNSTDSVETWEDVLQRRLHPTPRRDPTAHESIRAMKEIARFCKAVAPRMQGAAADGSVQPRASRRKVYKRNPLEADEAECKSLVSRAAASEMAHERQHALSTLSYLEAAQTVMKEILSSSCDDCFDRESISITQKLSCSFCFNLQVVFSSLFCGSFDTVCILYSDARQPCLCCPNRASIEMFPWPVLHFDRPCRMRSRRTMRKPMCLARGTTPTTMSSSPPPPQKAALRMSRIPPRARWVTTEELVVQWRRRLTTWTMLRCSPTAPRRETQSMALALCDESLLGVQSFSHSSITQRQVASLLHKTPS